MRVRKLYLPNTSQPPALRGRSAQGFLRALGRLFLGARGLGFYIGFVFLGLGSTVFAYLLFKSRYVPRALPAWGVFSSLLLALGSLAVVLFPWFEANASMAYMVPMFFYECRSACGFWSRECGHRPSAERSWQAGASPRAPRNAPGPPAPRSVRTAGSLFAVIEPISPPHDESS